MIETPYKYETFKSKDYDNYKLELTSPKALDSDTSIVDCKNIVLYYIDKTTEEEYTIASMYYDEKYEVVAAICGGFKETNDFLGTDAMLDQYTELLTEAKEKLEEICNL